MLRCGVACEALTGHSAPNAADCPLFIAVPRRDDAAEVGGQCTSVDSVALLMRANARCVELRGPAPSWLDVLGALDPGTAQAVTAALVHYVERVEHSAFAWPDAQAATFAAISAGV